MSILDLTAAAHKERRPTSNGVQSRLDRFRARFDYLYAGKAVLATETSTDVWLVTPFPGVSVITATSSDGSTFEYAQDFTFYGGQSYEVSNGLAQALVAAGYEVQGEAFSSGFGTGFEV